MLGIVGRGRLGLRMARSGAAPNTMVMIWSPDLNEA